MRDIKSRAIPKNGSLRYVEFTGIVKADLCISSRNIGARLVSLGLYDPKTEYVAVYDPFSLFNQNIGILWIGKIKPEP